MDTSVLSIRLLNNEVNQIDAICTQRGITRTEWLSEQLKKADLLDQVKQILASSNKRSYYGEKEIGNDKLLLELKNFLKT